MAVMEYLEFVLLICAFSTSMIGPIMVETRLCHQWYAMTDKIHNGHHDRRHCVTLSRVLETEMEMTWGEPSIASKGEGTSGVRSVVQVQEFTLIFCPPP